MRHAVHIDVDLEDLPNKVGRDAYVRGTLHLQRHGVEKALWNGSARSLVGTVRASRRGVYSTMAKFSPDPVMRFEHGECSCPMASNCKHVVALVLSMTGASEPRRAARKQEPWERSLKALFPAEPLAVADSEGPVPLAIELTLAPLKTSMRAGTEDPGYRLMGRVVRPSGNGWAVGDLSWSGLRTMSTGGDYIPDHVRLLQDLYTAYGGRDIRPSYSYYYPPPTEKTIELSGFESRQLWRLLDEAREVGLQLVHSRASLGPVRREGDAQLCLDAASRDDHLLLTPAVVLDGAPADVVPLVFIGSRAHGVVYADRADVARTQSPKHWPLRIARLMTPADHPLQRMALAGSPLRIPEGDLCRFRDEYYPALRHRAAVISTDQSFTPPAISGPDLVLHAAYRTGHVLDLRWEWAYEVGDSRVRTPLRPAGDSGLRDFDAERAIVRGLDVSLESFGLRGADPSRLVELATLHGIETMRFTQEALPLLQGHPGVVVEIDGEPADYREAGDSLRVGVSADAATGEIDWFDLGISITVEGREVPFLDVFMALSRDDSQLLLPDGAFFSLGKPELQALRRLIDEARALQETPDGPLRISRYQVGLWDELAALGVVDRQARAWQRQIEGLRALDSVSAKPHPEGLLARLRPYQVDGFSWLSFLWEYQLGGILADDMGLGKTIQALALICHAKQADTLVAPFLIVAPTSVVGNWAHEAARFAPGLRVVAIADTMRRRDEARDETVASADVIVTSYTLLRLDADEYLRVEWSGLFLDEAQFVKNHKSKVYQCARKLPAPFKLAITGTPMENNLMELWSLLSITAPGLFPNPNQFRDYYAQRIEKDRDDELLAQLRRRIRPLIKRRTKEQVAVDLPAKQEQVLEVELHPRHRTVYQRQLQRERQKVLGLIDDIDHNRFTILRSLTLLRQLSLHAGLVDAKYRDIPSAKTDALVEQLDDVLGAGHRALVFSQFTGLLHLVRARLDAVGVDYCYLDGRTRQRPAVIERFKNGSAPLFLISLKAGGVGLNLTEADYCFLLDPWWNPATEAQAIDRTHRIGQTRNVIVYRLIAADTIEQKVMALNARKAQLFASIMNDGNAFDASLDADDIKALFA